MPTVVQFRRGTTVQNNNFTGAVGEISVDTEIDTLRVHDGSTAGGFALVNTSSVQNISNKNLSSTTLTDNLIQGNRTGTTVSAGGAVEIDSYPHGSTDTAIEYLVLAIDNTAGVSQTSKYVAVYDGSADAGSEYGVVFTGANSLGTLSFGIDGANLKLYFTRAGSNTLTVKVFRTVVK
jgi:hypothetical protein